jgi:hypothetical protein
MRIGNCFLSFNACILAKNQAGSTITHDSTVVGVEVTKNICCSEARHAFFTEAKYTVSSYT